MIKFKYNLIQSDFFLFYFNLNANSSDIELQKRLIMFTSTGLGNYCGAQYLSLRQNNTHMRSYTEGRVPTRVAHLTADYCLYHYQPNRSACEIFPPLVTPKPIVLPLVCHTLHSSVTNISAHTTFNEITQNARRPASTNATHAKTHITTQSTIAVQCVY